MDAGTLTKGALGYGMGPTEGFTEICPLQSWAVPGAVPWTSKSTKLNPQNHKIVKDLFV